VVGEIGIRAFVLVGAIPEPSAVFLLLLGAAFLALSRKRAIPS